MNRAWFVIVPKSNNPVQSNLLSNPTLEKQIVDLEVPTITPYNLAWTFEVCEGVFYYYY